MKLLNVLTPIDALHVSGQGHVGFTFTGSEIVDVGGLGGPGVPGNHAEMWGTSSPYF